MLLTLQADLQPPFALQPSIWWMAAWAARRWAEGQLQRGAEPAATLVTKYALEADLRWVRRPCLADCCNLQFKV